MPLHYGVWRTFRLGAGPLTSSDFECAFAERGIKLGEKAKKVLTSSCFRGPSLSHDQAFAVVRKDEDTAGSLGDVLNTVCEEYAPSGLSRCEPSDAAEILLQYGDQPLVPDIGVVMDPIEDLVFVLRERSYGKILQAVDARLPPLISYWLLRAPLTS